MMRTARPAPTVQATSLLWWLALVFAALSQLGAAPPGPYWQVKGGALTVATLPDVLSRKEVAQHLTTGLTTSFVVSLKGTAVDGSRLRGAARVTVRWEPWDEVFHVAVLSSDGTARREVLPGREQLASWWRDLHLQVMTGVRSPPREATVELGVIPFSQAEERDAQRWFTRAAGPEADGTTGKEPATVGSGGSPLASVVDLLMATSIQRRSIVRYAWEAAPLPGAPGGGTG